MPTLDYILVLMPSIIRGAVQSIKIFAMTLIFSMPLGLIVSFGSMSRLLPIRFLSQVYVFVLRGTPLLLQLFFVYYALPLFSPIKFTRFTAAIVAFVLNYSAYFSEIFRAGIQSIDNGQYEAAHSMAYTRGQTMRLIILPQAVRRVIPPVSNEVITLVKDTALVYAIAIPELLKSARDAANRDVNPFSYVLAAAVYLLFTFLLTLLSKYLEKRYSRYDAVST